MQWSCHDGTKKPPIITAASHVASGLMLAPVASAQPKLTNAGPATWPDDDRRHTVVHVSSIIFFLNPNLYSGKWRDRGTRGLTTDTLNPPPDPKHRGARQQLGVDPTLSWHAHRPHAIKHRRERDRADG